MYLLRRQICFFVDEGCIAYAFRIFKPDLGSRSIRLFVDLLPWAVYESLYFQQQ